MSMAATTKRWTLEELHSLPDDGNGYEVIHGELFITPTPTPYHEEILARLRATLTEFVAAQGLGHLYSPHSVIRLGDSEVEPDLMVRERPPSLGDDWEAWPVPILVIEALSPFTWRRDHAQKSDFYINDARIEEYWIVDPDHRSITSIRVGKEPRTFTETLTWSPAGASEPLTFAVTDVFG